MLLVTSVILDLIRTFAVDIPVYMHTNTAHAQYTIAQRAIKISSVDDVGRNGVINLSVINIKITCIR